MNSTNSNEMMHNKATQEEEVKTLVWWDINSCPVPDGYDAGLVRPSIASALTKAGYSAPLTITALGNLNHTLKQRPDVLPAISSSGILLKHLCGDYRESFEDILQWTWFNSPPATLMFISDVVGYAPSALSGLQGSGYTILLAFPQQALLRFSEWCPSSKGLRVEFRASKQWLWESLLKDATDSWETSGQVKRWKCSETGESPCGFYCTLCTFPGRSFEDFTTHLKSRDHALSELNMLDRPVRRNKKWCIEIGVEEEWDRMSL